jgi:Zn-dependent peptidase ImmA (M78 family)
MDMPKRIVVGTQIWKVIERNRNTDGMLSEDNYGYTLHKENTIVVDAHIASSRKKQTLLHEIFHAIRYTFGGTHVPKKETDVEIWEHYFIGLYEEGMLVVLRDNPDLLSYLLEKE